MSSKGLEMLRKHLSYYDFDPDKVVLLGNVLYYAKKAELEFAGLEAENAKLREQIHWLKQGDILHVLTDQEYIDQCEREHLMQVSIDALDKENAKLRELVRDMWHEGMCECGSRGKCASCEYDYPTRMRELGVEVDE